MLGIFSTVSLNPPLQSLCDGQPQLPPISAQRHTGALGDTHKFKRLSALVATGSHHGLAKLAGLGRLKEENDRAHSFVLAGFLHRLFHVWPLLFRFLSSFRYLLATAY
jgi:hypothetical protein